jgi:hypothetical protein
MEILVGSLAVAVLRKLSMLAAAYQLVVVARKRTIVTAPAKFLGFRNQGRDLLGKAGTDLHLLTLNWIRPAWPFNAYKLASSGVRTFMLQLH